MDSVIRFFNESLDQTWDTDHTPLFNGYDTPYEALMEGSSVFRDLSFADRCSISAGILALNLPLSDNESLLERDDNRVFLYNYTWRPVNQDHICIVLDVSTGEMVYDDWFTALQSVANMESVEDMDSLLVFLVNQGQLIPGDTLLYAETDQDEGEG